MEELEGATVIEDADGLEHDLEVHFTRFFRGSTDDGEGSHEDVADRFFLDTEEVEYGTLVGLLGSSSAADEAIEAAMERPE